MKESAHGFAGIFERVKFDLSTWHVPFRLPPVEEQGIRLAAMPDIAALKFDAVIHRKEEKDFRDIHALLSRYSLAEMLDFYRERFPHHNVRIAIDHLAAAFSADRQQPIQLIKPMAWEQVTDEIALAIQHHLADLKAQQVKKEEERLQKLRDELEKKKKP